MADNPPESLSQQEEATAQHDSPDAVADPQAHDESYAPDELQGDSPQDDQAPADVNLDLILDVPVTVSLHVGSTEITIRDLVQLVEGSVVALERESSQPMDVQVNGTLIAHGEIVVIDEQFGVRLTDVVSPAERIRKIN